MLGNRTKLRFLRGHHCAVLLNRLTPHIRRRNGSLSILTLQRGTLAHRSRPRKVPSSKSAVIRRGRYRISPKRGWARCNRNLIHKKILFHIDFWLADNVMISNYAAATRPQTYTKLLT